MKPGLLKSLVYGLPLGLLRWAGVTWLMVWTGVHL